jgi:phosphoenolpyruvate-dependent sugar phosphotransferase system EIIA component
LFRDEEHAMRLVEFLQPGAVVDDLTGSSAQAVLAELARPLAAIHRVDAQRLIHTLVEREKLGSTGIGEGVAIPHGKIPGLPALIASFGRSKAGVDFRVSRPRPFRRSTNPMPLAVRAGGGGWRSAEMHAGRPFPRFSDTRCLAF